MGILEIRTLIFSSPDQISGKQSAEGAEASSQGFAALTPVHFLSGLRPLWIGNRALTQTGHFLQYNLNLLSQVFF